MQEKPIIGVTIGDPSGIGPEIALKSLLSERIQTHVYVVLIGDAYLVNHLIGLYDLPLKLHVIDSIKDAHFSADHVNLIHVGHIKMVDFSFGQIDGSYGQAAYDYIVKSIELVKDGHIDAITTAPIHKEALKKADIPYIGHTEIFAGHTLTQDPLTMFEVDGLRVFFLSRHVSLSQAIDLVKKERIEDYIMRSLMVLKRLGIEGKLAVAALNPHAGEHGLFGQEELEEIVPAISHMQEEGYGVVGPIPADSIFAQALSQKWAGVLSLYHDQGHIATKTYDFHRTVSMTLGLPFIRTSVDHGTAMDIVGKGMANETSMVEAIMVAAKYARYY